VRVCVCACVRVCVCAFACMRVRVRVCENKDTNRKFLSAVGVEVLYMCVKSERESVCVWCLRMCVRVCLYECGCA